ncbi:MAG TPA: isochorismatase family protein [Spirochaetota bacterium]|nr:isochorismatase family protein [Spirochaetota bacterium]
MDVKNFYFGADDTALFVIDVQDSLFNSMEYEMRRKVAKNVAILIELAKQYNLPIVVTEQYRKGLGSTIKEVMDKLEGVVPFDKLTFDCMKDDSIREQVTSLNKRNIIVCGIETHICVLTTSLSLMKAGYNVVIASDAVCSRRTHEWDMAIQALRQAGVVVYPTETIAFMMLEKAGSEIFKKLSPLFK